ncbi:MAG: hypothetical protein ACLU9S_20400 [Oscillospiraceae bacterium]
MAGAFPHQPGPGRGELRDWPGVELYNLIATFANFFANVFNDPVGAIINLFAGMFDFILGIVESAASLIDTVLGTDMVLGGGRFPKHRRYRRWRRSWGPGGGHGEARRLRLSDPAHRIRRRLGRW